MASLKNTYNLIKSDAMRLHEVSDSDKPLGFIRLVLLQFHPVLFAMVLYRWSHYFSSKRIRIIANFLYRLNITMTGADITPDSNIGPGCLLVHTVGLVLDVDMGKNCTVYGHVVIDKAGLEKPASSRPLLGDNVVIYTSTFILGGVVVADDVTVCPYNLVTESIGRSKVTVNDIPGKERIYFDTK